MPKTLLAAALLLALAGCASTPTGGPSSAAAASARGGSPEVVLAALNFLDTPYRRGGNSAATGFDCSGFTRHIFEQSLGVALPRRADEQAGARGLVDVARGDLQPGDLVFFNTLGPRYSHVGIYVGEGRFIHAPKPGAQVRVEDIQVAYWARRYTGARRLAVALADDGLRSP